MSAKLTKLKLKKKELKKVVQSLKVEILEL
jgi:hypothetical protein